MWATFRNAAGVDVAIELPVGVHEIGSDHECRVRITDAGVQRRHARLVRAGAGALRVIDLGAPRGIRINDERVVSADVQRADVLRVGDTDIRFRIEAPRVIVDPVAPARLDSKVDDAAFRAAARRMHQRLIAQLDLRRRDVSSMSDRDLRDLAADLLRSIIGEENIAGIADPETLRRFVLDEALGLGPLEALLADDSVREIMINGADTIFVERGGYIERAVHTFSSESALRGIVDRIVSPLGRRIDDASPMVDARLPDGSRVNVVIPPLALCGTAVTIRRFGRRRLTSEDLVASGTLDRAMLEFLAACVRHRRNLLVSGGTGSGKTTLLNVLSSLIPHHERVITIEDSAELSFDHPNLVALETRPQNIEGRGEVTIRDLVRNALRMRPDRIVVGECRGGETLDMLQAMNTGHDGSLSTVHANSPRETLSRLEVMVLMSGVELPIHAIREQIAASIHIIVHQARFAGGQRRITRITEVTGVVAGTVQTQDIFRFQAGPNIAPGATDGAFVAQGHVPQFYEELARNGAVVDLRPFATETVRAGAGS